MNSGNVIILSLIGRQTQNYLPFTKYLRLRFSLALLKMPSNHKQEKPWDTDDVDKWKVCGSSHSRPYDSTYKWIID